MDGTKLLRNVEILKKHFDKFISEFKIEFLKRNDKEYVDKIKEFIQKRLEIKKNIKKLQKKDLLLLTDKLIEDISAVLSLKSNIFFNNQKNKMIFENCNNSFSLFTKSFEDITNNFGCNNKVYEIIYKSLFNEDIQIEMEGRYSNIFDVFDCWKFFNKEILMPIYNELKKTNNINENSIIKILDNNNYIKIKLKMAHQYIYSLLEKLNINLAFELSVELHRVKDKDSWYSNNRKIINWILREYLLYDPKNFKLKNKLFYLIKGKDKEIIFKIKNIENMFYSLYQNSIISFMFNELRNDLQHSFNIISKSNLVTMYGIILEIFPIIFYIIYEYEKELNKHINSKMNDIILNTKNEEILKLDIFSNFNDYKSEIYEFILNEKSFKFAIEVKLPKNISNPNLYLKNYLMDKIINDKELDISKQQKLLKKLSLFSSIKK